MTAFVVAVSPETASESVVDLAPRNFSRTAEPMETPAMVLACERREHRETDSYRSRVGRFKMMGDTEAHSVHR